MGVEAEEGKEALKEGAMKSAIAAEGARSLTQLEDAHEKRVIEEALRRNDNAVGRTAASLSISRITLWRKMRKHGIAVPDAKK